MLSLVPTFLFQAVICSEMVEGIVNLYTHVWNELPGCLDNKQNAFKFIKLSKTALFVLRSLLKETEDIHSKRRSLAYFIKYLFDSFIWKEFL